MEDIFKYSMMDFCFINLSEWIFPQVLQNTKENVIVYDIHYDIANSYSEVKARDIIPSRDVRPSGVPVQIQHILFPHFPLPFFKLPRCEPPVLDWYNSPLLGSTPRPGAGRAGNFGFGYI